MSPVTRLGRFLYGGVPTPQAALQCAALALFAGCSGENDVESTSWRVAEARSSSGERAVAELGVGLELHVERNALVLRSDSMVRRLPAEVEKVGATALQIRLVTLQPPRVARIEMVSASEAELTGFSGNAETRIVLRRASR